MHINLARFFTKIEEVNSVLVLFGISILLLVTIYLNGVTTGVSTIFGNFRMVTVGLGFGQTFFMTLIFHVILQSAGEN